MTEELAQNIISILEDSTEVSILFSEDGTVIAARRGEYKGHNWSVMSPDEAIDLLEAEGFDVD